MTRLAERTRALALVRRPSRNGTPEEADFGRFLTDRLRGIAPGRLEVETRPIAGDPLGRALVLARLRGDGRRRVLVLLGHYDTVGRDDYGPLAPLALDPERLTPAFAQHPDPVVRRHATDGSHLFGRGVRDMKSGIAAGVAAVEALAEAPRWRATASSPSCPTRRRTRSASRRSAASSPGSRGRASRSSAS